MCKCPIISRAPARQRSASEVHALENLPSDVKYVRPLANTLRKKDSISITVARSLILGIFWLFDSCQLKLATDQYYVAISRALALSFECFIEIDR